MKWALVTLLLCFSAISVAQECPVEESSESVKQYKDLSQILAKMPLNSVAPKDDNSVINLDFSQECADLIKKEKDLSGLDCNKIPAFELTQKDPNEKEWKVRFHFGYSQTKYFKTDIDVNSPTMNTVIKGVQFQDRPRGYHYNPANWKSLKDATGWIDEPTNTMILSFEKGKNNFYLTVFHPKYCRSLYYKKDQEGDYNFEQAPGENGYGNPIPAGKDGLWIQNSHLNLQVQVGYGRQLTLFASKKYGRITYIPKVDVGLNYSKARTINYVEGQPWELYNHTSEINGFNASVGHRLEYQKGVLGIFADHKVTYSKMNQEFLDGSAQYNLVSAPLTFGVSVDLFSKKKNKPLKN